MLKAESLIHLAKNAWREMATAPTVLEEVIAAAKDPAIPLTSKQRLGIINNLRQEFVTTNSARAVVELTEALNPEHQGKAVRSASYVLLPKFGADNLELFDRLADIVVTLQSDKDKSLGMHLLRFIHTIPASERLTRFDRLASLSETIGNEQVKGHSITDIAAAIRNLPSPAMNDRFTKYADVSHSIQDDAAKATAATALSHCIWDLPQNDKRDALNRLDLIARSIDDAAAKEPVVRALRTARFALP
jgi:hypothetical protein